MVVAVAVQFLPGHNPRNNSVNRIHHRPSHQKGTQEIHRGMISTDWWDCNYWWGEFVEGSEVWWVAAEFSDNVL